MKQVFLSFFLLPLPLPGLTQSLVSTVRVQPLDAARLEIFYTLSGPTDSVWFEAETRFGPQIRPSIVFIHGDFGRNVPPGPNRRIVWNLYDDGHRIKSDLRVRVLARPLTLPEAIVQKPPVPYSSLTQKRRWVSIRRTLPLRQ